MPWKLHFGFKLSSKGRVRAASLARSLGFNIIETGWDYVVLDRALALTDLERDTILNVLLRNLFWQEEII